METMQIKKEISKRAKIKLQIQSLIEAEKDKIVDHLIQVEKFKGQ